MLDGGGELICISMSGPAPDLGDGGSCGITAILRRLDAASNEGPNGLRGAGWKRVLIVSRATISSLLVHV